MSNFVCGTGSHIPPLWRGKVFWLTNTTPQERTQALEWLVENFGPSKYNNQYLNIPWTHEYWFIRDDEIAMSFRLKFC